jgi:hypothetical protein
LQGDWVDYVQSGEVKLHDGGAEKSDSNLEHRGPRSAYKQPLVGDDMSDLACRRWGSYWWRDVHKVTWSTKEPVSSDE